MANRAFALFFMCPLRVIGNSTTTSSRRTSGASAPSGGWPADQIRDAGTFEFQPPSVNATVGQLVVHSWAIRIFRLHHERGLVQPRYLEDAIKTDDVIEDVQQGSVDERRFLINPQILKSSNPEILRSSSV